jgi:hypothetical protein
MFKTKNKLLPLSLNPNGKLKKKILNIAVAMLLPSLLLIDIINVRTADHENGLTVFIKNIHLMAPWGLAYLIATRHRDLLKIFAPLYMSLILLAMTSSLAFNHFAQSNIEKKFEREMANIMNDYAAFLNDVESSLQKPPQIYSADEYGHFAVYLNKFKTLAERFKQEEGAVVRALNEVGLHKIHTDEVIFNFLNIIKKKKELEILSLFLVEAEKRIEDIHSEYVTWGRSSAEVEKGYCLKGFATGLFKSSEEKKFPRQEFYRIRRSIVQEYIKFLSFLSKAYGNYEKADGQIVLYDGNDLQTFSSHFDTLEELFKEEETSLLALQEGSRLIIKPSSLMNETKSDPLDQILTSFRKGLVDMDQAFAEVDLNNIFTEEILFDLAKIHEKKKKLGQIRVTLDTTEKKLEEQIPGLGQQILSMHLSDQVRKKVEIFNETIPAATKKWLDIKRKCVLEFIKLLDFLSMRYGTYTLNENHGLYFSYEIETKLCESYLNNIKKFFKEEEETAALVQQCTQGLSK